MIYVLSRCQAEKLRNILVWAAGRPAHLQSGPFLVGLELGVQSYNVRGIGLFKNAEDIANIAVTVKNGTPIYVKQLGAVNIGAKVPIGRVGKDAESDIVQGVVLMRRGEKSLPTLERVREKVVQLNNGVLPRGMTLRSIRL